ncbi:winged helix-turn-helix domain-containing protein [Paraburkholderia phenazinium]|uniref:Predicted ATPase n=1 Tax=Paraburkholderia phenazinium TaxID=60549 RepID=A0A1G8NXT9_9BURK|nr:winged helix-turn-helix domain-containing protein [Paraburkholderia phenazinium]SDI85121.1 Predicted ATPase [Paraburkholderia phenazinium]
MSLPRLTGQMIAFSRFWLAREVGLLIADGAVIELGTRPFAVLAALLDAGGRVLSTAQLREIVWPGTNVDANTVQAQISAIRRALNDERDLIVTVPGRGYRFAGEIRLVDTPDTGLEPGAASAVSIAASLATSFMPAGTSGTSVTSSYAGSASVTRVPAASFGPAAGSPPAPPLGTVRSSAPRGSFLRGARPVSEHAAPLASPLTATPLPTSAVASLRSHSIDPSPFVGRHAELSELLALVPTRRIVTLTGASGIGKTRLATEAASRLASHFPDGAVCAALASLAQPDRVVNAIAAALGQEPNARSADAEGLAERGRLAALIGARRILLIVDHCDHLSDAAGATIEALVASTRGLHVIATCETPLFIAGESTVAVAPLRVPPEPIAEAPSASSMLDYDALHLLLTRLFHCLKAPGGNTAPLDPQRLAPDTLAAASLLCRRIDGVPYAVELAAATIAAQVRAGTPVEAALAAFAADLDAMMTRRTGARRIVLPRAAMVHAMLDISYAALDGPTRTTLRRLGVFADAFAYEAALDVLGAFDSDYESGPPGAAALEGQLRTLVAAGLVNEVDCDGALRLRLPQSVRRFALGALERTHESTDAATHHAQFVARDVARRFGAGLASGSLHSRHDIDALRAALEWAVSADKLELCVDLLDNTAPVWVALSLVDEYVGWARAALARVDSGSMRRIRDEMRLRAVLARALTLRRGTPEEIVASWQRTYELANICADMPYRLRALFSLAMGALEAGEVLRCREISQAFSEIADATQWPAVSINARRIEGIMRAYAGDFDAAIRLLSPVVGLSDDSAAPTIDEEACREANAMATGYGLSLHLVARAVLAATQWLAGEPNMAAPLRSTFRDPAEESEPVACCVALGLACALAALDDDIALAESCAAALVTRARVAGLRRWLRAGLDFRLWLDARRGDQQAARRVVSGALKRIARERIYLLDVAFIATLLPRIALKDEPELTASLAVTLLGAVMRSERTGELWYVPELLRLGALVQLAKGETAQSVRPLLHEALQRARQHGAQRLALRITVDLEALDAAPGISTGYPVHRSLPLTVNAAEEK